VRDRDNTLSLDRPYFQYSEYQRKCIGCLIPLLLPWIPIIIWFRPKLRILTTDRDKDKLSWGLQILAWFAIGVPCIIGQFYITASTAKLVAAKSVEDIRDLPPSRYYSIENFGVDSAWMSLGEDVRTSGKYNQDLNFHFYFIQLFTLDLEKDAPTGDKVFWYGVNFKYKISNSLSDENKERKYKELYEESLEKMRHYKIHDVTYFKR
jgi:rhomboid protease GluP